MCLTLALLLIDLKLLSFILILKNGKILFFYVGSMACHLNKNIKGKMTHETRLEN